MFLRMTMRPRVMFLRVAEAKGHVSPHDDEAKGHVSPCS